MKEEQIKGNLSDKINVLESSKSIAKGSNTNIIVVTNKCNFDCTYCFERDKIRKEDEFIITKEEIEKYIDDIKTTERNPVIVIFGGEPLLAWDRIEYIFEYAKKSGLNPWYTMNTNGYRFKNEDFFKRYCENEVVKSGHLSTEISFDGIGNVDRILKSKRNTTIDLINILNKFKEHHIVFRISYTIHNSNENIFDSDIKNIIRTFKPERLIINIDYSSNHRIQNEENVKERLLNLKSFKSYKTCPICRVHCDECNLCGALTEKYRYYNVENDKIFVKNSTDITNSML